MDRVLSLQSLGTTSTFGSVTTAFLKSVDLVVNVPQKRGGGISLLLRTVTFKWECHGLLGTSLALLKCDSLLTIPLPSLLGR